MRLILISLIALVAAACAGTGPTLTAQQCTAEWEDVGRADGLEGAFIGKIEDYQRACAGSGAALTAADVAAWERGWEDGVEVFCEDRVPVNARQRRAAHAYCGDVAVAHHHGGYYSPRISGPRFGVGITAGSRGVRTGVGIGYSVGIFNFGLGYGF